MGPTRGFVGVNLDADDIEFVKRVAESYLWRNMNPDWLRAGRSERQDRTFDKRAFNNEHRAANIDHYRELERERARRYRLRKKGILA